MPELDPAGEPRQAGRRDDRRTACLQGAFVVLGVAGVQRLGDGQVHDRIAEELEPLVVSGSGVWMLMQPR